MNMKKIRIFLTLSILLLTSCVSKDQKAGVISTSQNGSWTQIEGKSINPLPPVQVSRLTLKGKEIVINAFTDNQVITSPISLTGKVPINWVFEGSFPVEIYTSANVLIKQTTGKASVFDQNGNPKNTLLVDFTLSETFQVPNWVTTGYILLKSDNPSGEAQNDDSYKLMVSF